MKYPIFKKLHSFFKDFWKKNHDLCWGLISLCGISITTAITSPNIFPTLLILFIVLFLISIIRFYILFYKKEFNYIQHFCLRNGRPNNPIIISSDTPSDLWINYSLGKNIRNYYIIIPCYIEYKIEFPELSDNLKLLSSDNKYKNYIIIKGNMIHSSILDETIGLNLTSIRNIGRSRFEVFYLVKNNLKNFEKKMKNFIDDELILQ